jgi:beta-galactosidase
LYEQGNQLKPWPWFNSYCGDVDLIGNKKPQSFYRDVVWRRSQIAMAVHQPLQKGCKESVSYWGWPDETQSWTWPGNEGRMMKINVYSRAQRVRLTLNGKMIGEKNPDSSLTAEFEAPYEAGKLEAVAIDKGKEVGSVSLRTANVPKAIVLKADRSIISVDRNDLSYVTVQIVDEKSQLVPNANVHLEFSVSGAGELAGVGNADPSDMASFKQPAGNTFRGKCLVILRPKGNAGNIVLETGSERLRTAKIIVKTKKSSSTNQRVSHANPPVRHVHWQCSCVGYFVPPQLIFQLRELSILPDQHRLDSRHVGKILQIFGG